MIVKPRFAINAPNLDQINLRSNSIHNDKAFAQYKEFEVSVFRLIFFDFQIAATNFVV